MGETQIIAPLSQFFLVVWLSTCN